MPLILMSNFRKLYDCWGGKSTKKIYIIVFLVFMCVLCSCGQNPDSSTDANNTSKVKSEDSNNKEKQYYGKWKIVKVTGSGYISSTSYDEKDYIDSIISIGKDSVSVEKNGKTVEIKQPRYKEREVTDDELFDESRIFKKNLGFKNNEKVLGVTVYNGSEEWGEFGTWFIVKDDKHLIFDGPMYFLAERQQD